MYKIKMQKNKFKNFNKTFFLLVTFFMFPTFANAIPSEPLLQRSDLVHEGSFRVPGGRWGTVSTHGNSFTTDSGRALSYNPINNSLFMVGHTLEILLAELNIPSTIIDSENKTDLTTATVRQNPIEITGGLGCYIGVSSATKCQGGTSMTNGNVLIGGTLVDEINEKLYGTTYTVYDGTSNTTMSHFKANLDWSGGTGTTGMYRVGSTIFDNNVLSAGFVDGYMTWIPNQWRQDFGGPAITGHGPMAIITRTSYGPSAFVFDPAELGSGTIGTEGNPAPISPLVYYPSTHQTLGLYENDAYENPSFNNITEIPGVVWPSGTRSVLFFGRTGLGISCYGAGTADQSQVADSATIISWISASGGADYPCGTTTLDGTGNNSCCYDPAGTSSKGVHNFPSAYYVWAYDALDLLDVKNGLKQPWEVVPYAEWDLELDLAPYAPPSGSRRIFGAAYDPGTQRVFISQADGDRGTYEASPIIQVFKIQTGIDIFAPTAPSGLSVQ
jgi:hypothetical protein